MDENRYIQVEGNPSLVRDRESGAILNSDVSEIKRQKELIKASAQKYLFLFSIAMIHTSIYKHTNKHGLIYHMNFTITYSRCLK